MTAITLQDSIRNKAHEIASRLPEETITLVIDGGISFLGGYAAEIGNKMHVLTVLAATAGTALGAHDGTKRALEGGIWRITEEMPAHFGRIAGVLLIAAGRHLKVVNDPFQSSVNAGIAGAYTGAMAIFTRSVVGGIVCLKERINIQVRANNQNFQRMPTPTEKAAEWAAGAFAGTIASGALVGSSGLILSTAAGVVATKAARAAVRGIQSRWFR